MKFTELTYFEAVDAAVSSLRGQNANSQNNKDCWIIVLMDGKFTSPEEMRLSEDQSGELKRRFEGITDENKGISIAYVPIGESATPLEGDRNKRIYTIEGSSIMEQVTQVINLIYGRVQLNESIKEKYIQQNGNTDKLIVNIDIPIEKMIVFLQDGEKPEDILI